MCFETNNDDFAQVNIQRGYFMPGFPPLKPKSGENGIRFWQIPLANSPFWRSKIRKFPPAAGSLLVLQVQKPNFSPPAAIPLVISQSPSMKYTDS